MSPGDGEEDAHQSTGPRMSWRSRLIRRLFRQQSTIALRVGRFPPEQKVMLAFETLDRELIYCASFTKAETQRLVTELKDNLAILEML